MVLRYNPDFKAIFFVVNYTRLKFALAKISIRCTRKWQKRKKVTQHKFPSTLKSTWVKINFVDYLFATQ